MGRHRGGRNHFRTRAGQRPTAHTSGRFRGTQTRSGAASAHPLEIRSVRSNLDVQISETFSPSVLAKARFTVSFTPPSLVFLSDTISVRAKLARLNNATKFCSA